jgi:hypothetical protein
LAQKPNARQGWLQQPSRQQYWPGWQQLLFCVQQVVPAAHAGPEPQRHDASALEPVLPHELDVAGSHAGPAPQRQPWTGSQ